jgi:aminopeptidase N
VREGFNDPDELVDGVTYVKAAEVIRMLRLILGPEVFRRARNLYFRRHGGGNANTDQFFACFEEVSGRDLRQFRREWLHSIGYPRLEACHAYDPARRRLVVNVRQSRAGSGGCFHVPMEMAAVDAEGHDIAGTGRIVEMTDAEQEVVIEGIPAPAFLSFNRDCSYYGTFFDRSSGPEHLAQQIRLDPNAFNRVEAMRRLTDAERVRLIHDADAPVGRVWLDTVAALVRDGSLPPGLKAYLLRIDEQPLDRAVLFRYREQHRARSRLLNAAAAHCTAELLDAFHGVDTYAPAAAPRDGIDQRRLKAVLLRTLIELDTPEVQALAELHFRRAWNITDKTSALACIHISNHPRRRELLEEGCELWREHLAAYVSYLAIVGTGVHDDVFEMIEREERRPGFHLEHPSHSRALFLPLAANNKMIWTGRGLEWLTATAIRMAPINENTTNRLIACFQQVNHLSDDLRPAVLAALRTMAARIDPGVAPSVAGRLGAYLAETQPRRET